VDIGTTIQCGRAVFRLAHQTMHFAGFEMSFPEGMTLREGMDEFEKMYARGFQVCHIDKTDTTEALVVCLKVPHG
jgi:regulator of replication initiation timing